MATKTRYRARRNDGSVCKRSDGRWQARYWITLPNGERKRQSVYGRTQEEARGKMRKEMAAAGSGKPVLRNGLTVEDFLNDWIDGPIKIRDTTRALYASNLRNYIIPAIGKIKLSSLKVRDIQRMIDARLADGSSNRHVQILRNTLSAALRYATNQELIPSNIARKVEVPKYERPEMKSWTEDEITVFLEAAKSEPKYYPVFLVMLTYGLRLGETLGLQWKDIDWETNKIYVRQQLVYLNHRYYFSDLKTKTSRRALPLLPELRVELEKIKPTYHGRNPQVFAIARNEIMKHSQLQRVFKKVTELSGNRPIRVHDMRHTVASRLNDLGITAKDVMAILGHASAITTMQYYQHSDDRNKEAALVKLSNAVII